MADREIQIRYQLRWIVFVAAAIILASLAFGYTLRHALDQDMGSSYKQAYNTLSNLKKVLFPMISLSVLLYLIIGSVVVAVVTIFISHRIAGPVFKMEMFADRLRQGDLSFSMRLRRGDQMGLLAEALRDLQGSLADRLRPLGRALDRADSLWDELDAIDLGADPVRAREILIRIDQELVAADAELAPPPENAAAR